MLKRNLINWGIDKGGIMVVLCITLCICSLIYYGVVIGIFMLDEYTNKNEFIIDLIPFYAIYRICKKNFDKLEG